MEINSVWVGVSVIHMNREQGLRNKENVNTKNEKEFWKK